MVTVPQECMTTLVKASMNATQYYTAVWTLRDSICREQPTPGKQELLHLHSYSLCKLGDNLELQQKLLDHPPPSPNLTPSDFHLFGPLKEHLRGKHFSRDAQVEHETTQHFRNCSLLQVNSAAEGNSFCNTV